MIATHGLSGYRSAISDDGRSGCCVRSIKMMQWSEYPLKGNILLGKEENMPSDLVSSNGKYLLMPSRVDIAEGRKENDFFRYIVKQRSHA